MSKFDAGDAIVLAWSEGQTAIRRGITGSATHSAAGVFRERPKYQNVGYANLKRHRWR